jgi:hypothetical protein
MLSGHKMIVGALWVLAAMLRCRPAHANADVRYQKFSAFFNSLDSSGDLSKQFDNVNGDVCAVQGIVCDNGQVVSMCASALSPCALRSTLRSAGRTRHNVLVH